MQVGSLRFVFGIENENDLSLVFPGCVPHSPVVQGVLSTFSRAANHQPCKSCKVSARYQFLLLAMWSCGVGGQETFHKLLDGRKSRESRMYAKKYCICSEARLHRYNSAAKIIDTAICSGPGLQNTRIPGYSPPGSAFLGILDGEDS